MRRIVFGEVVKIHDERNWCIIRVYAELGVSGFVFHDDMKLQFPSEGEVIWASPPRDISIGYMGIWEVEPNLYVDKAKPKYSDFAVTSGQFAERIVELISLNIVGEEVEPQRVRKALVKGISLGFKPYGRKNYILLSDKLIIGPVEGSVDSDLVWKIRQHELDNPLNIYEIQNPNLIVSVQIDGVRRKFTLRDSPKVLVGELDAIDNDNLVRYSLNYARKHLGVSEASRKIVQEITNLISIPDSESFHRRRLRRAVSLINERLVDSSLLEDLLKSLLEYPPFIDIINQRIKEEKVIVKEMIIEEHKDLARKVTECKNQQILLTEDITKLQATKDYLKHTVQQLEDVMQTKIASIRENPFKHFADVATLEPLFSSSNKSPGQPLTYSPVFQKETIEIASVESYESIIKENLLVTGVNPRYANLLTGALAANTFLQLHPTFVGSIATDVAITYCSSSFGQNGVVVIPGAAWSSATDIVRTFNQLMSNSTWVIIADIDSSPADLHIVPFLRNIRMLEESEAIPNGLQVCLTAREDNHLILNINEFPILGPVVNTDACFSRVISLSENQDFSCGRVVCGVDLREFESASKQVAWMLRENLFNKVKLPLRLKDVVSRVGTFLFDRYSEEEINAILFIFWILPYIGTEMAENEGLTDVVTSSEGIALLEQLLGDNYA